MFYSKWRLLLGGVVAYACLGFVDARPKPEAVLLQIKNNTDHPMVITSPCQSDLVARGEVTLRLNQKELSKALKIHSFHDYSGAVAWYQAVGPCSNLNGWSSLVIGDYSTDPSILKLVDAAEAEQKMRERMLWSRNTSSKTLAFLGGEEPVEALEIRLEIEERDIESSWVAFQYSIVEQVYDAHEW